MLVLKVVIHSESLRVKAWWPWIPLFFVIRDGWEGEMWNEKCAAPFNPSIMRSS